MTPALLLPGTLCSAALWAGVLTSDETQIIPVIRGTSLVDAAERVLAHAPRRVHLVGFSLGAIVALEVLRRFPERLEHLTLISANLHAPVAGQLRVWDAQEQQIRHGHFEQVAERTALGAGAHQATVLDMALDLGPEVMLEQLALLRTRPDSRADLTRWQGPLTLLVGENDTTTPPALAEAMVRLAPQAELRRIPQAGHYLPLDAPGAVADALREATYV
ncbi:alpha/beta fold hydrolase [Deinococcus alpinitundrae]|uniref:alpha/beta fold hydrolase n=1 Tax=Deinococcus alpinitundrae TaxID=468913 RepID=UPI00137A98B1|nr:alpha/beta hydrolase [Deinococcus alpinitundrae]